MSNIELNQLKRLSHIIQTAALKNTADDQVEYILTELCNALAVDVCSLYRRCEDNSLSLASSHGLIKNHPIVIPAGKGLVGKVMSTEQAINVIEPSQYPEYYYVSDSTEERLHSFCGVPIFSQGSLNGVLVVQSLQPKYLDNDQLALLTTLAIHLGLLLDSVEQSYRLDNKHNVVIHGVPGSSGLSIGRAFVLTAPSLFDVVYEPDSNASRVLEEWRDLKEKAKKVYTEEYKVLDKKLGENLSSLIGAYLLMLEDPALETRITEEIEKGTCLPWALKVCIEELSNIFKSIDDPYLQARHEDIENLGDNLFQLWSEKNHPVVDTNDPLVLIGRNISISSIVKLLSNNLVGIICTEGAALSHIAIFANALGIPSIMGTGEIPLDAASFLVIDGDSGQLILNPDKPLLAEYESLISDRKTLTSLLLTNVTNPAVTLDGQEIAVMANSGLDSDVDSGLRFGAEGIGLYRTELPFMTRSSLPSESDQYEIYKHVLEKYEGKPVYLRTLDIGSDKPLPYLPELREENPALGLRGIRYTLNNVALLSNQLRAILRAGETFEQLHLIFPMISTTEQLDQALELLDKVVWDLKDDGFSIKRPKVGIMLEVPASLSLLPMWKDKIDFISVGTNDLTQYLLAIDRNNALVEKYFDHLHPAVLHELSRIAKTCKKLNLSFSICGELASMPIATIFLLGIGCKKFSLSAAKIPLIKALINNINLSDAERALTLALKQDNAHAIRSISEKHIKKLNLPFENLIF